jgi:hypothetical protein
MKQISEVEEKSFTSSLNIYPEACHRKGSGGVTPHPFTTTPPPYLPADMRIFQKEDDVTVILLLLFPSSQFVFV